MLHNQPPFRGDIAFEDWSDFDSVFTSLSLSCDVTCLLGLKLVFNRDLFSLQSDAGNAQSPIMLVSSLDRADGIVDTSAKRNAFLNDNDNFHCKP